MFKNNPILRKFTEQMVVNLSADHGYPSSLKFEDYRELAKFENLMEVIDQLLLNIDNLESVEVDALLHLTAHGLIQYQTEQRFENIKEKSFDLSRAISTKILRTLSDASANKISIIRELIDAMYSASMTVSEELLEQVNQTEYNAEELDPNLEHGMLTAEGMIAVLEEMVQTLETESDYDIYAQVAIQLNQLPTSAGLLMASALLRTKPVFSRDSAILLLLHPQEKVRQSVSSGLVKLAQQGLLNSKDKFRLMVMRNWVNETDKKIFDQAIKLIKFPTPSHSIEQKKPVNRTKLLSIFITPADSGGSMGLHFTFKKNRKHLVLGMILKQDIGVIDAFFVFGLSKSELQKFVAQANSHMPVFSQSIKQIESILAHFLATNLKQNTPIPVELLVLIEELNIERLDPKAISMENVGFIVAESKLNREEILNIDEVIAGWGSPSYLKDNKTEKILIENEFEPYRASWYERLKLTCVAFAPNLEDIHYFLDAARAIKADEKLTQIPFFQDLASEVFFDENIPELPLGKEADILSLLESGDFDFSSLAKMIGLETPEFEQDDWQQEDFLSDPYSRPRTMVKEKLVWQHGKRVARSVYQLKISLQGSKPAIWRRVLVMNTISLEKLHQIIQVAMGWSSSHLYEFEQGRKRFGPPAEYSEESIYDDRDVQLRDVLYKVKAKLEYVYDFGDNWQHKIILEEITPAKRKNIQSQVLKAVNACPPEDVGGLPGYSHLLKILKDPFHDEYQELCEWIGLEGGKKFDYSSYDIELANKTLADAG